MVRETISFGTFNLYNLNLPGLEMYGDDHRLDEDTYRKKLSWSASVLSKLKADIWGFQELWHQKALKELFEQANMSGDFELLTPNDHSGEKIVNAAAVKSKLLVGNPEWIIDFPAKFRLESQGDDDQTPEISVSINKFSRPVLHFQVQPHSEEEPISVYVAHLKSKTPTNIYYEDWYHEDEPYYQNHQENLGSGLSTIRRTAEASALRMMLTDKMKNSNTPVVVLGDLNDAQHSNTLNIITG